MRPCPCRRIAGTTRRVSSCQPKKFASNWARSISRRHVFERAGLRVGAVVEERVERAAGRREYRVDRRGDRIRLGVVEIERVEPLGLQRRDVLGLAGRGEDAPAARLHAERAAAADAGRAAGDQDCARHAVRIRARGPLSASPALRQLRGERGVSPSRAISRVSDPIRRGSAGDGSRLGSGRPSSVCSSRCTDVAGFRSSPRTTSVMPWNASSMTTERW